MKRCCNTIELKTKDFHQSEKTIRYVKSNFCDTFAHHFSEQPTTAYYYLSIPDKPRQYPER